MEIGTWARPDTNHLSPQAKQLLCVRTQAKNVEYAELLMVPKLRRPLGVTQVCLLRQAAWEMQNPTVGHKRAVHDLFHGLKWAQYVNEMSENILLNIH